MQGTEGIILECEWDGGAVVAGNNTGGAAVRARGKGPRCESDGRCRRSLAVWCYAFLAGA